MPTEEQLGWRVMAGAAFLDEHDVGWRLRVTKPIRVANTHECPLAQLYGRYRDGVRKLGLSDESALMLGFRGDSRELGTKPKSFKTYYEQLDRLWEIEVAKRV